MTLGKKDVAQLKESQVEVVLTLVFGSSLQHAWDKRRAHDRLVLTQGIAKWEKPPPPVEVFQSQ